MHVYMYMYLWYAVLVSDNPDQFVEREEGVAPDLCGNILTLSAQGQQLNKIEMIGKVTCIGCIGRGRGYVYVP